MIEVRFSGMGRVIGIWISFVFVLLLCVLAGCEDECVGLVGEAEICGERSIVVQLDDHYPVVDATLDGEPLRILLDTGVGYYEETPSFGYISASLLGVQESNVELDSLCLGDMCLKNIPMYALDSPFSDPGEDAINGTLGMGFLRYFDLEIDYMNTVSLSFQSNENTFEICSDQAYGFNYGEYGRPHVEASADEIELSEVLVDTGAYYTLFSQETSDEIGEYLSEGAVEEGGCTIDGCVDDGYFVSTLNEYCVYDECASSLDVKFPVWDVVGCSYLKTRRVVFLFDTSELFLCSD